ncbi:nitrogen fixation protein NifQ [Pantoea sp. B65]|uniref:nitrogen fixation protein NifQ n=1 Tax=Pantoea sp. B65 TaxID=2813359 RepID=UPI0039B5A0CC
MAGDIWLAQLLANYQQGQGHFAPRMGLSGADWRQLLQRLGEATPSCEARVITQQQLIGELQSGRQQELTELADWLAQWQAPGASPMHQIIASVALGFNHLWQDLGLSSRETLRLLMSDCFPQLVVMNHANMRWKKFFYRQRCLQETGELLCRSPSCDDCCEWAYCFAAE